MDGQQWVLVITSEVSTSPTIVGPFEDVATAAKVGKILEAEWLIVKLATINPLPTRLMERLENSKEL